MTRDSCDTTSHKGLKPEHCQSLSFPLKKNSCFGLYIRGEGFKRGMLILEGHFFDAPEPPEPDPVGIDAELPAENYFKRVNSIPLLTRAEESELIERWRRFRDEKARDRVIGSLRIPPAIARKAARRFEPNKHVMSSAAIVDAWKGHRALIEELTAEGNLALVTWSNALITSIREKDSCLPRMPEGASAMRSGSG